ncbi:MAG: Asp-tRNA(Asn)/Glu-tRNA(Gln) amidotransferase subunit GatA [Desulfobacterales bacterium]
MELHELTIAQARRLLAKREISARELAEAHLSRIEALDAGIGAFLTVTADQALTAADASDRRIAAGQAGSLEGIPLALKDVLCTRGVRTSCASRILENFVPPYDATAVARLRQAGAVLLGKLNMDEFAMGSSTENSAFQVTRNPWDPGRTPGGSSGGSAAAVAARLCLGALGSDTGGSIRQPASHCGVVGLKPTYGRVSRYGLVAFASSLDQVGPFGRTVEDAALLLEAIAGHDPADSTSAREPVPAFSAALGQGIRGLKIGIPAEYRAAEGLDPEVGRAVEEAVADLARRGAEPVEISLPHTRYAVAVYYVIAPAEASSNLARYDGVKYGRRDGGEAELLSMYRQTRGRNFGPEVRRRIVIGTYCLSAGYYDAYYGKASQVRSLIVRDFAEAFKRCDAIACPTAPTPAFRIGEKAEDPLTLYLADIFTIPANLAGIPAVSVPCAFSSAGLPIGLQLMGRAFDEETILRLAHALEAERDLSRRRPC